MITKAPLPSGKVLPLISPIRNAISAFSQGQMMEMQQEILRQQQQQQQQQKSSVIAPQSQLELTPQVRISSTVQFRITGRRHFSPGSIEQFGLCAELFCRQSVLTKPIQNIRNSSENCSQSGQLYGVMYVSMLLLWRTLTRLPTPPLLSCDGDGARPLR